MLTAFQRNRLSGITALVAFVVLAALPRAQADTTLRYKLSFKSGGMIPVSLLSLAGGAELPKQPPDFVIRLQGEKARVDGGVAPEIVDLGKQQITLLDPAHQRFATGALQDYTTALAASVNGKAMPPVMVKAMSAIKITSDSRKTGQINTILGIQAEETDVTITVTMDLPDPSGASTPALQGPILRLELQLWTALPSESLRVATLAQMETFNQIQALLFDPAAAAQKVLAQLPASLRDSLTQAASSFSHPKTLLLRMRGSLYSPMLAGILQAASHTGTDANTGSASAQQKAAMAMMQGMDPKAPLGEMTLEASELSDGPVDAALFTAPDGYQPESVAELMKAVTPTPPKMPATAPSARGSAGAFRVTPSGPGRAAVPALPDVPEFEPGAAVPADERDWFRSYVGQSSHTAIIQPEFRALLQSITPDASYHMGVDVPLSAAVFDVLHGPGLPVESFPDGGMILAAKRSASGRGKAFIWLNSNTGQAIGGLLLFYAGNRPSPELTLFSTQIAGAVNRQSELPAGFAADFRQWSAEHDLPAVPAEFFVNHDGATSVIVHPPATCARTGAGLCEAVNSDAADTDMQAALYLVKQRYRTGAAAAEITSEQEQWQQNRTSACATPAGKESALGCRARMTRERTAALLAVLVHPPGA